MTEKERMLSGSLYCALDEELSKMLKKGREIKYLFNDPKTTEEQRYKLLKEHLIKYGKNSIICPPLQWDYGCHISIGDNFFANYECIFLDVNQITIGNNVFLAPRVSLLTAGHPIDKDVRNELLEFGKPITIGNDVWIGGNTVVNPGVTIGNNVVIGSGSVVTKDIPDGVIAYGNPCRVQRKITKEDQDYWKRLKDEYYQSKK